MREAVQNQGGGRVLDPIDRHCEILFLCGYGWGRYAGARPRRTGLNMVLLGVVIQAVVIALGV